MNSSFTTHNRLATGIALLASAFIFNLTPARADIVIGGDVYGGGSRGEVGDSQTTDLLNQTNVIIRAGKITGSVYGGGELANVNGGTHVNLDAAKATAAIVIGNVYGGNDKAGIVSGKAFVESTYGSSSDSLLYVTNLFGGGNGDYDYTTDSIGGKANPCYGLSAPDIAETTVQLLSGCYSQVFGGGNCATVTGSTTITLNNSTSLLKDGADNDLDYQFDRVFGGNNKVAMAIRPTWDLTKGLINNLYSGGNAGDMTHPQGILLAVKSADMTINNMYGGCRMADVNPAKATFAAETLEGYPFPANHAARVLVTAGKINNVYGGNDVSGNVYGGNALEIRSSIINDVYGGGNGSYTYTDKEALKDDATWGDFYYEIPSGKTSAQALYDHRPNAEAVNMHVVGTEASPTYIGGGLYCGGNSATLAKEDGTAAVANLKIGSYVVAKEVFLGSNGENMVTTETLQKYADTSFSGLALTNTDNFEEYMRGCEVSIKPLVSFDDSYTAYSSKFESLFCGGNVGSMSADGYFNLDFLKKLVIYDKLVGGCNNANVAQSTYNAEHKGGLTTQNNPKVILNIEGVQFEPKTLSYNEGTFTVSENVVDGYFKGGNLYGGCYASGYVNGGVEINIKQNAIRSTVSGGTSAHTLADHRDNVFNTALSAFGGGYGKETEIRGNVDINISDEANIIKVFGGGEMGVVNGNTTISQTAGTIGKIYGGGFEGLVEGNALVKLDGGSVYDAFGGACNADINGYAELIVGNDGTPAVGHNLFGGNDFGGQIKSAQLHPGFAPDNVKSNTYILYKDGTVAGGIYGGSYGSYDYNAAPYSTKAAVEGFEYPKFTTKVAADADATILANSFVDIQTSSPAAQVTGNIYGGGYGYLNLLKGTNQLAVVDMNSTYVLLRSTNTSSNVANEILGGGYYSVVDSTRVDARSGLTTRLYGGTYGATAATSASPHMAAPVNYRSQKTTVNVYSGLNASSMDVFGGGANAGSVETNVNLLGGTVKDVYGGSNMEGVVVTANVNVPTGSTSVTDAIFGGGYGSDINLPCDVLTANVNWASNTAYVSGGAIYGGNNSKRATKITNITVDAPVKKSSSEFASIAAGGNGENTVTGYTHVTMNDGAHVKNIYGGGRDGKVYGFYDDKVKATTYYDESNYPRNVYAHWAYTASLADETWGTKNAAGVEPNTNIILNEGSVAQNVYGAGFGATATVSGNTYVKLNGGTVTEDIFGGGYSGNLYAQEAGNLGTAYAPTNMTGNLYTFVDVDGGTVRNVYGGGFNGNVGNDTAEADTRVKMGAEGTGNTFLAGAPAVQLSIYGGGYKGSVVGTAKTRMYDGYVGYNYNAAGTDDPETKDINEKYEENLNYVGNTNNLLKENGNVFGGGYGEGATVDHTDVILYDGVIRNSMYGGGEIAAIGRGTVNADKVSATVAHSGSTLVNMYGGLVTNDVFGGGRGYAIDAYGNTQTGETGYSDGYTFGTTQVYIHRGKIGTTYSVADGHGNVFGGGNIGYVYTASGTKSDADGYYYNSGLLTEDCKVVVSPSCVVTEAFSLNGHDYAVGDYVTVETLDSLVNSAPEWAKMDDLGITIGNAVFAGGNVSAGSDKVYANAKTVFGNATASVTDVFNKDFIAIGDDGIGGLYGDGNLTFVDGYRELNITNYGTDYYNLSNKIDTLEYLRLTDRERSYFMLEYQTAEERSYSYYETKIQHNDAATGITYKIGQKITASDYNALSDAEKAYWEAGSAHYYANEKITGDEWGLLPESLKTDWTLFGFCTLYAGRMINTIQRADFCGVFGSRICLRGAQDRVTTVADYTNYTINRVKEVSLNREPYPAEPTDTGLVHGNYFGIYNVVNYLGALTSDVDFWDDVRVTSNTDSGYKDVNYGTETGTGLWANWKLDHLKDRKRNNGSCKNQVALASGVWLEIVDESTEKQPKDAHGNREKIYGPITGVVELDLLNVVTGEGGGYVYAKNVHGVRSETNLHQVTLTAANDGAVSQKQFEYAEVTEDDDMQTSGNFVHSTKRIVDDCYPMSNAFYGQGAAPAHYWYIRGEFYVYDQYISAYTGSAQAYAETVSIPLTITAEAQGKLQLESINDNLYAYWSGEPAEKYKSLTVDDAIMVGGITYQKNDPITYWDYNHLTSEEKNFFRDETYVCTDSVVYNSTTYHVGDVILPAAYDALPENVYICLQDFIDGGQNYVEGQQLTENQYNALGVNKDNCKSVKSFFHITNAVSHDRGFLLTFDWDNPEIWDDYYHSVTGSDVIRKANYEALTDNKSNYILSPTFSANQSGVFGQQTFVAGDLVEKAVYDAQSTVTADLSQNSITDTRTNQAVFEVAYIAKQDCEFSIGEGEAKIDYNYVKGAPVAKSVWDTFGDKQTQFEPGYICTETYQVSESQIFINGEIFTNTEYDALDTKYPADAAKIKANLSPVYICSADGLWGGNVFVQNHNYEAIKYSNLSSSERDDFHYNYDALDLLSEDFAIDGVTGLKYQGGAGNHANNGQAISNQIPYCTRQSIDYTATYDGTTPRDIRETVTVNRGGITTETTQLKEGDILINTEYERLTNEQACYTPFIVQGDDADDKVYYIANEPVQVGDVYYNTGKQLTAEVYLNLSDADRGKVTAVTKSGLNDAPTGTDSKKFYFCTKSYSAINAITDLGGEHTSYAAGQTVPVGTIILEGTGDGHYGSLENEQKNFTIDGRVPTQTSTLYVARETDIKDLSEDKIVTVIYWYEYVEADETGSSYETIRERHIVNVHVHFESGVPSIGELLAPSTVLPGTKVGLNQPAVSKGAYEILGGGWEMYTNQKDAQGHKNGVPYTNNNTKMYWYQDGYYVAYYAKSYLGKTYSNPVQFSVANYHRMNDVMSNTHVDPESGSSVNDYMYLDEAVKAGKRDPKVYINSDAELGNFALFFTETTTNDNLSHVKDAENLDFFLQADINHEGNWTPVGTATDCFEGTFNGDGHTISGLNNSLFGYLCNDVYNLGVTGSFTGGGVADTGNGYVENCWVATTGTPAANTLAVFGNPNRSGASGLVQIVNCYYPETNKGYTRPTSATHGLATMKPVKSFVNGEVAYDLNGFYLTKRYYDGKNTASGSDYQYWTMQDDTTHVIHTAYYPSGVNTYVENYYGDGDFRYSNGMIPLNQNIRENNLKQFFPVYPDDYIFFGQKLTYDATQDNHPAAVVKTTVEEQDEDDNRRIVMETNGNRVFRAPAYYRSKEMNVAHFNNNAVFTATYTVPAGLYKNAQASYDTYKGMTAIDFTGKNDDAFVLGWGTDSIFNKKVLDYAGLESFKTDGITQNLLAYIPAADPANADAPESKTNTVLNEYFNEPDFVIENSSWTNVSKIPSSDVNKVKGHTVQKNGEYVAHENHFLVDKQDFNAPIEYTFADDKRMWYQREPQHFVESSTGAWETIALPFTAALVSAHQKGAISHFYGDSNVGHEYWLRGFTEMTDSSQNPPVQIATFARPDAGSDVYQYSNQYLWDTYFSQLSQKDANEDEYQEYYNDPEKINYSDYTCLQNGEPYIVAFPGNRFYEFDMSGQFQPQNTANDPAFSKLAKQTITYASAPGSATTIGVSDDLTLSTTVKGSTFRGTFLNDSVSCYAVNAGGTAFETAAVTVPFRAYFDVTTTGSGAAPKRIVIGQAEEENEEPMADLLTRGLTFRGEKNCIVIESTLEHEATVIITSLSGQTLYRVTVQPESREVVPVNSRGIYIANRQKVAVL